MIDVMVDLETMGTNDNALFPTLGACAFDIKTGAIGAKIVINFDWDDCLKAGGQFQPIL
jgi:hypothetical protein